MPYIISYLLHKVDKKCGQDLITSVSVAELKWSLKSLCE